MPACKACGHWITWQQVGGKWKPFDAGDEIHHCRRRKARSKGRHIADKLNAEARKRLEFALMGDA